MWWIGSFPDSPRTSIWCICSSRYLVLCWKLITGPPNGSVLFCMLSSVGVVCNSRGRSAAAGPGAWPVRRPTLHGGTVRLRPVRATSCFVNVDGGDPCSSCWSCVNRLSRPTYDGPVYMYVRWRCCEVTTRSTRRMLGCWRWCQQVSGETRDGSRTLIGEARVVAP